MDEPRRIKGRKVMDEPRRIKVKVKLEDGTVRKGILARDKRKVTITLHGIKATLILQTKSIDEGRMVREVLAQDKDGCFLIKKY